MIKIPVSGGHAAIVDDCDYFIISGFRWRIVGGYPTTSINLKTVKMHRLLLQPGEGRVVDHINGDTLDNRRSNLRVCQQSDNVKNRRKFGTHSRFIGVQPFRTGFAAKIRINGKNTYLGSAKTEDEAARIYDHFALQHHGPFARLNFPKESA